MCELFGVSADARIEVNGLLKEFFSHSERHPNGWGLAVFHENSASVEKEPVKAVHSNYLRERLSHRIATRSLIAHIRLATVGSMDYENCHPFVQRDCFGRCWTFAHNGTMFDCPVLNPYFHVQEGRTDSERILCYFISQINKTSAAAGRELTAEERYSLIDRLVCEMTPGNKMNFLLYDSESMYVHTNYANSLYFAQREEGVLFATVALGHEHWTPVPFTTLCVYQGGRQVYTGTCHGNEYFDNKNDLQFLYLDSAGL